MTAVTDRILAYNQGRVQKYLPLKYAAMSQNPFRFFRGTCHLFYEDLFSGEPLPDTPAVWICGDLHIENFGSYKGDNRLVYFDLNDFDEALLAPAAWELVRFITSVVVAFDSMGVDRTISQQAASGFLAVYSDTLAKEKARYIDPLLAKGIVKIFLDKVALRRQKELLFERAVKKNTGVSLKIDKLRLFKLEKDLRKELVTQLNQWMQSRGDDRFRFNILDTGFRIAGTGSIGMKRYMFLLQKADNPAKYLFLDMKQAGPSSVLPFIKLQQPAWPSEATRVTATQYRMQNVPPALLSTMEYQGDSYVMKEMQPTADKIDFELIRNRGADISQVIHDMAVLTASAQLRSTGRQGSVPADHLIGFGKETAWQQALVTYALAYADRVKKDHADFAADFKKGLPGMELIDDKTKKEKTANP